MINKLLDTVKNALSAPKKVVPVNVTGPQIAAMRVRPFKGSKKRPVFVDRPSLKQVQSRIHKLNRIARSLRGALRRASSPTVQLNLGDQLKAIAGEKAGVLGYVRSIQTVAA